MWWKIYKEAVTILTWLSSWKYIVWLSLNIKHKFKPTHTYTVTQKTEVNSRRNYQVQPLGLDKVNAGKTNDFMI